MEQAKSTIAKLKKNLEDANGNLNKTVESYAASNSENVRFKNPNL
jgi:hypothetical protein